MNGSAYCLETGEDNMPGIGELEPLQCPIFFRDSLGSLRHIFAYPYRMKHNGIRTQRKNVRDRRIEQLDIDANYHIILTSYVRNTDYSSCLSHTDALY